MDKMKPRLIDLQTDCLLQMTRYLSLSLDAIIPKESTEKKVDHYQALKKALDIFMLEYKCRKLNQTKQATKLLDLWEKGGQNDEQ